VVIKYGITKDDTWNFDETGYRVGIARSDWIITVDPTGRIHSKDPDNRESLTGIECISGEGKDIPLMLIMTEMIWAPILTTTLMMTCWSLYLIQVIQATGSLFAGWSTLIASVKSIKRELEDCEWLWIWACVECDLFDSTLSHQLFLELYFRTTSAGCTPFPPPRCSFSSKRGTTSWTIRLSNDVNWVSIP